MMFRGTRLKPTVRRTQEQIAKDRQEFKYNYCKLCKEKLGEVSNRRNTAKMCADCRGYGVGKNGEVRGIFTELSEKKIEPAEDEIWFEDDPRALNEVDFGKVSRQATEVSYGVSELADIMTDGSNHYRYKDRVESKEKRYSYRKGKN